MVYPSETIDEFRFDIDPRGNQEAAWATVVFSNNRIGILIQDSSKLWLTEMQTEELSKWLVRRLDGRD